MCLNHCSAVWPSQTRFVHKTFVRRHVTTVVVKYLLCIHGFVVHLGAQMPVCCTCDAHIQKSNEVSLFEFVCELYDRYDAVDVGLEPVKAVFFL